MSAGNSVAAIVPAGNTLYVATTFGVAGMAGVGGGALSAFIAPDVPKPGLWKSTDAGSTFSLMFDDSAGAWGINDAEMDATGTLYIASVGKGIYRSSDGGSTWEQVYATQLPVGGRVEFALTRRTDTPASTSATAARARRTPACSAPTRSTPRRPRR